MVTKVLWLSLFPASILLSYLETASVYVLVTSAWVGCYICSLSHSKILLTCSPPTVLFLIHLLVFIRQSHFSCMYPKINKHSSFQKEYKGRKLVFLSSHLLTKTHEIIFLSFCPFTPDFKVRCSGTILLDLNSKKSHYVQQVPNRKTKHLSTDALWNKSITYRTTPETHIACQNVFANWW